MAQNNQEFERLKQKYQPALQLMRQLQVQLQGLGMEGGKLLIRGVTPDADVKNKVWDQIKVVDAGYSDLVCDLTISQPAQAAMTAGSGAWTDAISDIFSRHGGSAAGTAAASADPHADYQAIAAAAPAQAMADALATAFRSDQTPSFPEMVSSLFRQSNPDQKAGLLSQLMGAVSPAVLAGVPELKDLAGSSAGGQGVTPQRASQISAEQVQRAAADAQRDNPSIVDQVSGFYARHPDVVKALGGAAISIAIQSMARRK
jgi:hypothetical protein